MSDKTDPSNNEEEIRNCVLNKRIKPLDYVKDYDRLSSGYVNGKVQN